MRVTRTPPAPSRFQQQRTNTDAEGHPQPQVFTVVVSVFEGTLPNKPLGFQKLIYRSAAFLIFSGHTPPAEDSASFAAISIRRFQASSGHPATFLIDHRASESFGSGFDFIGRKTKSPA